MKICTKCGLEKPTSDFYKLDSGSEKLRDQCKPCTNACNKKWRNKNRKTMNKINYKSRKKHWPKVLARQRSGGLKVKIEVLSRYGVLGGCVCCGEKQINFLTIDHVKDNGSEDREAGLFGRILYRRLKKLGFPEGYQTLCFNCNWGKRLGKGFCPHHPEKDLRNP